MIAKDTMNISTRIVPIKRRYAGSVPNSYNIASTRYQQYKANAITPMIIHITRLFLSKKLEMPDCVTSITLLNPEGSIEP